MPNVLLTGSEPVLFDGAMGTRLFALGHPCTEASADAIVRRGELVRRTASEYAKAGADVLVANTFGVLDERVEPIEVGADPAAELAIRAVALARAAAERTNRPPNVAVSFAPLALRRFPANAARFDAVLERLADLRVDAVLLETQTDVKDACRAAAAARRRLPHVPLFVSFTFGRDDLTLDGFTPEVAARSVLDAGADVPGANCSFGPERMRGVVERLAAASPRGILAKPNAGLPDANGIYPLNAREFARSTAELVDAGARFVGGCCGTTPDAIARLRRHLDDRAHGQRAAGA